MTDGAYREFGREMDGDFEEGVESYEGFGVRIFVQRLDGAVEREPESFYALPDGDFAARLRRYARWGGFGLFPAFIEQVRHPAAPVSWSRRVGFALRLALELPLMFGHLALVRPGKLRARHAAELAARSGKGAGA